MLTEKHIFPHELFVANILNTATSQFFILTNHARKHKKSNIAIYLEITQKQNKKI